MAERKTKPGPVKKKGGRPKGRGAGKWSRRLDPTAAWSLPRSMMLSRDPDEEDIGDLTQKVKYDYGKKLKRRKTRQTMPGSKGHVGVNEEVRKRREAKRVVPRPSLLHMLVIDEYFRNGYKKAAALREAGYAESVARKSPHSVFGREDVKLEIDRRRKQIHAKYEVTEDRIVRELAKVGFANLGDYIEYDKDGNIKQVLDKVSYEELSAVAGLKFEKEDAGGFRSGGKINLKEVKLHDKMRALEALARIKGMYQDTVKVTVDQEEVDILAEGRKRLNSADVVDVDYEEVE